METDHRRLGIERLQNTCNQRREVQRGQPITARDGEILLVDVAVKTRETKSKRHFLLNDLQSVL